MDTYTIFETIRGGDIKWKDNSLEAQWVMEVILVTVWVMEVILVTVWVMEVILSIIMDMEAILFTTIMDSIMVVDVIRVFTMGTVVNLQNRFNPCSDVFRGFKFS